MSDLDQILEGTADEQVEETAKVEESKTEQVEEPKTEEVAEPEGSTAEPEKPNKELDEGTAWQYEAYKDEKRKRQELERRVEELAKPREPEKAPDVFEDQSAYTDYINNQISQSQVAMRAEMSQFHAERELGKDVVSQKLESFRSMVKDNPALSQQVFNSPSPVYEALDIVDKAEKLEQLGNVESLEAKVRGEIEEKIRAEIEEKYKGQAKMRESVTPSLNNQSSGSTNDTIEDTLESLLG